MKKLNKKKTSKESLEKKEMLYLFYMTDREICAKDIGDLISGLNLKGTTVEIWESMNVVQVEIEGCGDIDFEPLNEDFEEKSDIAFVKNRGIKTIFMVTSDKNAFEKYKDIFMGVMNKLGGFFCTDSEDFKPIYDSEEF